MLGALVGYSRVYLGAHSTSESALGWLLGAGIAYLTWRLLDRRTPAPRLAWGVGLILLLALSPNCSSYLPTHTWEQSVARAIAGRGVLYSRDQLHRAPRVGQTRCAPTISGPLARRPTRIAN